jgi:hypothetical protein
VSNAADAKGNLDFDSVWIGHCVTDNRPTAERMRDANFVCIRPLRNFEDSIVRDLAGRVSDFRGRLSDKLFCVKGPLAVGEVVLEVAAPL